MRLPDVRVRIAEGNPVIHPDDVALAEKIAEGTLQPRTAVNALYFTGDDAAVLAFTMRRDGKTRTVIVDLQFIVDDHCLCYVVADEGALDDQTHEHVARILVEAKARHIIIRPSKREMRRLRNLAARGWIDGPNRNLFRIVIEGVEGVVA